MRRKIYSFHNKKLIQEFPYIPSQGRGREISAYNKPTLSHTPEQIEWANRITRTTALQLKLNAGFDDGGYLCTLTFDDDSLPDDFEQAKKAKRNFAERLRYHSKRQGLKPSYIILLEKGADSGRWHIHIVINGIPDIDTFMHRIWPNGQIQIQPLRTDDDYRQLASYLAKTPRSAARCSSSRNIVVPAPQIMDHITVTQDDFYLPDSNDELMKKTVYQRINPVTQTLYRRYAVRSGQFAEEENGQYRMIFDEM